MDELSANHARFVPGQRSGFYESFFQRGNHPSRPLAFWIRYTLFWPDVANRDAGPGAGELWAILFDGETGAHVAVKREVPIDRARFDRGTFHVTVDDAELRGEGGEGALRGSVASGDHRVAWDMRYRGGERPLFLFSRALYETALPRAKSLVGAPLAVHEGSIDVDGRALDVSGWVGSQNHNWGSRHTDHYAWGQVAGFDTHPSSFLEVATARLKLGPIWTPFMTPIVLRHEGREHAINAPLQLVRSRGAFEGFTWRFGFETSEVRVDGRIAADHADFVGLAYKNPPGGIKHCLNTKIASCDLTLVHKSGAQKGSAVELSARRRAAFEILTDDHSHGVAIRG